MRIFISSYVADRRHRLHGSLDDLWSRADGRSYSAVRAPYLRASDAPPMVDMAAAVISASITIGWTRSVWLAAGVSAGLPGRRVETEVSCAGSGLLLIVGWFICTTIRSRARHLDLPVRMDRSIRTSIGTSPAVGIEMIKAHPWFGIGPDMPGRHSTITFPPISRGPLPEGFYGHLHNVYLQFGAERGIPALLAFLALIGITLGEWWRSARAALSPSTKAILHGSIACLLAILVGAFFEHNLGDSEILSMFWIVVAWGYRAREAAA